MTQDETRIWLSTMRETVSGYRRMIDAAVEQLSDEELFSRPERDINSVAVILRHLGGNLHSRWTDFLTSDGEKPDRDRDAEFTDWVGDRQSLLDHFNAGWAALESAIATIDEHAVSQTIYIRGESHSVAQALLRSVTHVTYHVGQIAIISRMVHQGDWKWLTVAPGDSASHNERTWGTAASRSIFSGSKKNQ
ncbi:DinB superfamily protein [Stieleria maiorica]|uniref:DinB superfamily protein n=1 Tax=Stieleria maiorica TaxID=2795974 RepID=A0A5B9MCU0_9BACT|nr:DinB family protein [Stieleria maiorica]QEF99062.1 DinB superfamily protein [Stieleria maiorica]